MTPGWRALASGVTAGLVARWSRLPAGRGRGDQSYAVARTVVLSGHGFGHGHGMSQYGAQGAAKQGLTYRQIIDFYYPGTTWSQVTGKVRVLISADTTSDVVVAAVPGLRLQRHRRRRRRTPLPTPNGVKRWRIAVGAGQQERRRLPDRVVAPLEARRARDPRR